MTPEKPCEACEKVRGQTLSEEAWEIAVLDNHHSLYQVAQLGLAVANAALSERDALIRALEAERDGLRAALEASAEFFASDTHEHCCVAMDEVQAKVRAALDGEGKL